MNSKQKIQSCFQNIIQYKKRSVTDQDFDEYVWHQFEKVCLIIYQENWQAMKRTHAALNYMWANPDDKDKQFEVLPEPIGQTSRPAPVIIQPEIQPDPNIGAVSRMDAEQERLKNTIAGQVEAEAEKAMLDSMQVETELS